MAKSYSIDMDGVIVRGSELIPGADEFIERLHQRQIKFLMWGRKVGWKQCWC